MYDVIIIGAGVVGGSIFRELTKYKLKVLVLEKENDVAMGTRKLILQLFMLDLILNQERLFQSIM